MKLKSRASLDGGRGAFLRKPLSVAISQTEEDEDECIERHLSLFDLVMIGAAGTIGSGVFALVGMYYSKYTCIRPLCTMSSQCNQFAVKTLRTPAAAIQLLIDQDSAQIADRYSITNSASCHRSHLKRICRASIVHQLGNCRSWLCVFWYIVRRA
jgi:hypothetical protein